VFLVVTDSGLGGLSICAALESRLRETPLAEPLRITYVNAWPDENRGYNDLPDMTARAAVFDDALGAIAALRPDRLLVACNTLSILYPLTRVSQAPQFPTLGIVDAGVEQFREALAHEPESGLVLLGTRTTIASGVHRDHLVASGIGAFRIVGIPCHGLATVIERDLDGPGVGELITACARAVCEAMPEGNPLLVGLCCTHYGYVADRIARAMSAAIGRRTRIVNPNVRLVEDVVTNLTSPRAASETCGPILVTVISKVALDDRTREGMGRLIGAVSPVTAAALSSYTHVPDLF
jgi:glutamate racemase